MGQENCKVYEPEKGDWLRRRSVLQWRVVVPTVPVPFFGRHHWGTVEKGDRHRAGKHFDGSDSDCDSEPVPLLHSIPSVRPFSVATAGRIWYPKE